MHFPSPAGISALKSPCDITRNMVWDNGFHFVSACFPLLLLKLRRWTSVCHRGCFAAFGNLRSLVFTHASRKKAFCRGCCCGTFLLPPDRPQKTPCGAAGPQNLSSFQLPPKAKGTSATTLGSWVLCSEKVCAVTTVRETLPASGSGTSLPRSCSSFSVSLARCSHGSYICDKWSPTHQLSKPLIEDA